MNTLAFPDFMARGLIGFDDLFEGLTSLQETKNNFPPYNIVKIDDSKYAISLAVAGFSKEDVDITLQNKTLIIKGEKKDEQTSNNSFIYKGISFRNWERRFVIDANIKVIDANMKDGILTISLEREIPEEEKPRKLIIS